MKKAVVIGINYRRTRFELNGCINDATNIKNMLIENLKFREENIIFLTDDTKNKPTRENILSSLNHLFQNSNPGDFCLIHYSGHGASILDQNRDEVDGRDEALVPIDYDQSGLIIDDELRVILDKAKNGVKIVGFLDCCHSNTSLDLRYQVPEINGNFYIKSDNRYKPTQAEVMILSGCLDPNFSYDVNYKGKASGALTLAILDTLKKHRYNPTRKQLLIDVRNFIVQNRLSPQIPQMSLGTYLSLFGRSFPI